MKKTLEGTIISNKMQKTVVVEVATAKVHPKYKKKYKFSKNYKADTAGQDFKIGDKVLIQECRPISKDKKWKVAKKLKSASQEPEEEKV